VTARVFLLDAAGVVLWRNLAAAAEPLGPRVASGGTIVEVLPLARELGVPAALARVAETGQPARLYADLVSTGRGRARVVASLERLPDGGLLLVVEHDWQAARRP
jgi:hypothetical protein